MSQTLREALNAGQPNELGVGARSVGMGNALGAGVRFMRGEVVGNVMTLPDTAKAAVLLGGYKADAGTPGPFTVVIGATAPGEARVNATGDIEFDGGDAVTEAEVYYASQQGEYVCLELSCDPATGIAVLPGGYLATGLVSADVATGGAPGPKTVVRRGTTPPAAGSASLASSGGAVEFNAADAVERVTVCVMRTPPESVSSLLEGPTALL